MTGDELLNAEELRVLACLIEKSHTTPDQYPMSTNALVAACNQKTSREPVVDYSVNLVDHTLQLLRDGGWARSKRAAGERTFKHRHVVDERLGLTVPQQAVVAVLALRGPQSPGELKTRTERYHPFVDLADVERVLADLAQREPSLVRNVGRGSGQSQDRWIQLIGPTVVDHDLGPPVPDHDTAAPAAQSDTAAPAAGSGTAAPAARSDTAAPATPPDGPGVGAVSVARGGGAPEPVADRAEVDGLRRRVAALEDRLAALERELGLG